MVHCIGSWWKNVRWFSYIILLAPERSCMCKSLFFVAEKGYKTCLRFDFSTELTICIIHWINLFDWHFFADPTTVEMKCKCNSVGYRVVNIIWKPLHQDADSSFEPSYYRVLYDCETSRACSSPGQGTNQLGCTLNTTTRQTIQQKELSCSITSPRLFSQGFYFKLEMTNSSGTFKSKRKTCRLASNGR